MYYQNPSQNAQPNLKTPFIIYVAFLIGQILFALVVFSITPTKGFTFNTGDMFTWIALALTIGGFVLSSFLYRVQLNAALGKTLAKERILGYTTAIIMRAAPLEAAAMFCIVAYMLSGNTLFMGIAAVIILYFAMVIPTKDRALTSLNLSAADLTEESALKF